MSWRPLIVCPQPALAERLSAALRDAAIDSGPTLNEYPRMGTAAALAARHAANICFLDVATNPEHAQLLIGELAPGVPVVALHHRAEGDLILRCLRRGAREFLTELSTESLRGAFERLGRAHFPVPQTAAGKIYCVIPGKAGCGASTLAAHLAVRMAAAGASLLVDCDALNASIAFQLKLKPEHHIGDMLRDWKRMDNDLWSRLPVHACGIDVLAAPENPAVPIELSRQPAAEVCSFWRERYASVVLDLPDVRTAGETGLAGLADAVLLVSTNELSALHSTRRAVEYLEQTVSDRSRLRLVLNRYTPATGLSRDDVKTALRIDPYAVLCNDYEAIQSALLEGGPAASGSPFSGSVEALAGRLQNRGETIKRPTSWLGLLKGHRSK